MALPRLTLYHYWRSSSSWRVRWALAYKKIPVNYEHVHLLNAENESVEHKRRHPLGFVPALQVGNQGMLIESLAMLDFLEQIQPKPSLYPAEPFMRAKTVELMEIVNSGIHPLQNLPTQDRHSDQPEEKKAWAQFFIHQGLDLLESRLLGAEKYSVGPELTAADLCIVPQLYNAARYEIDPAGYPKLNAVWNAVKSREDYIESHPDRFEPKN